MKVTIGVIALFMSFPAEAHCFSRWYYPTPQHCGGIYARHKERIHVHNSHSDRTPVPVPSVHDIVKLTLPDMNGVWQTALTTKAELELWEEMQRKKALMLIKGEN